MCEVRLCYVWLCVKLDFYNVFFYENTVQYIAIRHSSKGPYGKHASQLMLT